MDGETIFGAIILIGCSFLCGGIFYAVGLWASKRKDPMHFWSGTTVDPKTITDVPAYNRENARMWKWYSATFFLGGIAGIASFWFPEAGQAVCLACLIGGGTLGLLWLIWRYGRIRKKYEILR